MNTYMESQNPKMKEKKIHLYIIYEPKIEYIITYSQ